MSVHGEPNQAKVVQGLETAREYVVRLIGELRLERPCVGITGPVASGKSTLASKLAQNLQSACVSTDRYLPDYADLLPSECDDPDQSDLARLAEDLRALRRDGLANLPIWSFHEHRRVGEEYVRSGGGVVCEGLFALHPKVLGMLDVRIFVEASAATRWSRWERIEQTGERGWGVERARAHFDEVAEPTFDRFAVQYRSTADLIVINDSADDSLSTEG